MFDLNWRRIYILLKYVSFLLQGNWDIGRSHCKPVDHLCRLCTSNCMIDSLKRKIDSLKRIINSLKCIIDSSKCRNWKMKKIFMWHWYVSLPRSLYESRLIGTSVACYTELNSHVNTGTMQWFSFYIWHKPWSILMPWLDDHCIWYIYIDTRCQKYLISTLLTSALTWIRYYWRMFIFKNYMCRTPKCDCHAKVCWFALKCDGVPYKEETLKCDGLTR